MFIHGRWLRGLIQKSNEYEEFNLFMLSQEEFKLLKQNLSLSEYKQWVTAQRGAGNR